MINWLFKQKHLTIPMSLEDLGYFAAVTGRNWQLNKQWFESAGFKALGPTSASFAVVAIARYPDAQWIGSLVLECARRWSFRAYRLWQMGFLDTPEGHRVNYRTDFRWNFIKTLKDRKRAILAYNIR